MHEDKAKPTTPGTVVPALPLNDALQAVLKEIRASDAPKSIIAAMRSLNACDARASALLDTIAPEDPERINRGRVLLDRALREPVEFTKSRTCADWRNYVPETIRELWDCLSPDARAAVRTRRGGD
jgi:hypothetical protein